MSVASESHDPVQDFPRIAQDYLERIGAGDEEGAVALVIKSFEEGVAPERLLLEVIGAAQAQVGRLWSENLWSVAREHAATAISERALAALAARVPSRPTLGQVVLACADGEWHALPMRLLADILQWRGWEVSYLGASVPGAHLVTHLHQTDADTVALSCMLPTRLPRAHVAITAAHSAGVPVIAGGWGFGADGRYARLLGADAWAARADQAADRLAEPDWPVTPAPPRPYTPNPEYHRVTAGRTEVIETALDRILQEAPPALRAGRWEGEMIAEDLGQIADFLAAALYVNDSAVFTEFVRWKAPVLAARGVPEESFVLSLEIYRGLLPGLPWVAHCLSEGVNTVASVTRAETRR